MKPGKRVLAVTVMAFSVLLIILLVAGIVGSWIANASLTDGIVRVSTGIDTVLANTDNALSRLDTTVSSARQRVDLFDETVAAAGENLAENPVLLAAIAERLDLGIAPAVDEVRGTVQTIRETILVAQNTVQALKALPFVSIGSSVADDGKLQALSEALTSLTVGVQQIRDAVRAARTETITDVVTTLGQGTSRLDAGLETIETAVSGTGDRVSALRTEVSEFKSTLTFWLDAASMVTTLALLWLTFAQVVTFVLGLSIYKEENLFARWIGSPPQ
jgi:uncharacterized phage infection (PIP) family protein YhgE